MAKNWPQEIMVKFFVLRTVLNWPHWRLRCSIYPQSRYSPGSASVTCQCASTRTWRGSHWEREVSGATESQTVGHWEKLYVWTTEPCSRCWNLLLSSCVKWLQPLLQYSHGVGMHDIPSLNMTNRKFFPMLTLSPSGPHKTTLVSLSSQPLLIPSVFSGPHSPGSFGIPPNVY